MKVKKPKKPRANTNGRPKATTAPGAGRTGTPGKDGSTGPKNVNWAVFRERYVTSIDRITYREIGEEAGVNPSTVERRAAAEDWSGQRKDHFTEVNRAWRQTCKEAVSAIKAENLQAIRATKTVILRQLTRGLIRTVSVGDLIALVRQELSLLGEPDQTIDVQNTVDEDRLREVLKAAIETGSIDRTALRRAAKNA